MDELIAQLAAKASVEIAVAEKTTGAILSFLRDEGGSNQAQALIEAIPGAEEAIAASNNSCGTSWLMGGGLMALGTRLMALGLSIGEIQKIARELFIYGRGKIGSDQMGAIIDATPGVRQFA